MAEAAKSGVGRSNGGASAAGEVVLDLSKARTALRGEPDGPVGMPVGLSSVASAESTPLLDSFTAQLAQELAKRRSDLQVIALQDLNILSIEGIISAIDKNPPDRRFDANLIKAREAGLMPIMCTGKVLDERGNAHDTGGELIFALRMQDPRSAEARRLPNLAESLQDTLRERLANYYGLQGSRVKIVPIDASDYDQLDRFRYDAQARARFLNQLDPDTSALKIFHSAVRIAISEGASDIHFEPYRGKYRVRFRVDGALKTRFEVDGVLGQPLIAVIKNHAQMRLEEKRVPQDGRIIFRGDTLISEPTFKGWALRASVLPTVRGEKSVLRLLHASSEEQFDLVKLKIPSTVIERMNRLVQRPQGLILITGPTGSGKTTTLYSILRSLNTEDVNLCTVEDPVEVQLEGVAQVQVHEKIDFTFAAALRSLLRQDPDIILIGEVRDPETARIAVEASMTGHLVFATVHTNDSFGVVTRLSVLNVDRDRLQSSLEGVITQRLMRGLCDDCKESYNGAEHLQEIFGHDAPPVQGELTLWRATGRTPDGRMCKCCNGTGFKGRIPVVELWVPTREEKSMMLAGIVEAAKYEEVARKNGMRTMLEEGLDQVKTGRTSLKELLDKVVSIDQLAHSREVVEKILGVG